MRCNPVQIEHIDKMNSLFNYFNTKTNLVEAYGEISPSADNANLIRELFTYVNRGIPFHEGYVPYHKKSGKLDLSVYRNAERAIDRWNDSLVKGINSFETYLRVPEALYARNPVTMRFSRRVSAIENAERRHKREYSRQLLDITKDLKQIMSFFNGDKKSYAKSRNIINEGYSKISQSLANADAETAQREMYNLMELLGSADSENVIGTYVYLMENYKTSDLHSVDFNLIMNEKINPEAAKQLVRVVQNSRALLNEMGDVNIKGLSKMKDVIKRMHKISFDGNRALLSMERMVDDAVGRIEEGMRNEQYYPHYSIESMLSLEKILDNVDFFKLNEDASYQARVFDEISSGLKRLTADQLARSPEGMELFNKDPIRVIESYSENATAFNKKQFLMDAYIEALQDLAPVDGKKIDGIEKITEYIAHKYYATNNGYADASGTVKRAAGFVSKMQTISKMGLALTGALRNSTQHFWYTTQVGGIQYMKGRRLLSKNKNYAYYDKDGNLSTRDLGSIMDDARQEAGYFFDQDMQTISKGLLINLDGVDKKTFKLGTDERGEPFVEFVQDGVYQRFDAKLAEAAGFGLSFHRFTENLVRRDVYRNAFANHFDMLMTNTDYVHDLAIEKGSKENPNFVLAQRAIEKQAHHMALNWVTMTQFDYSQGGRPGLFGGLSNNASVIGNSTFQFFVYSANMFEMNTKLIREAYQSIMDGNINNYKVGAAARMFGFQILGVGLASIVLNNEFRYLIQNDTFERLRKLYYLMSSEQRSEKTFGNGLLAQFTGPVVSDMLFWMEFAGFNKLTDNEVGEILAGYYGVQDMAPTELERAALNRISVQLAKLHRSREHFIRGDLTGMIRANFSLYPSKFTRDNHEALMNMLGLSRPSRKAPEIEMTQRLLEGLPDEQRDKMLSIVRQLRERKEPEVGVPTGLEELTPR